jgi:hypothetical protein
MKTHIMRNCRDLCEEAEAEAAPQNSKARASNNPHSHRPTSLSENSSGRGGKRHRSRASLIRFRRTRSQRGPGHAQAILRALKDAHPARGLTASGKIPRGVRSPMDASNDSRTRYSTQNAGPKSTPPRREAPDPRGSTPPKWGKSRLPARRVYTSSILPSAVPVLTVDVRGQVADTGP